MKRIVSLTIAVSLLALLFGISCGGKSEAAFAIITDSHLGYEGKETYQKLQATVETIIKSKNEFNLLGVIVLGDITDKGQKSDFVAARDILNRLHEANLPYIPLMGNHDTWEYTMIEGADPNDRTKIATIADIAKADQCFEEIFWGSGNQKNIQLIKDLFGDSWQKSYNPIDLPDTDYLAYLQNYGFSYGGITFVSLDFSPRADPPLDLQHADTPSARPGDKRGSFTSLHEQTIEFSLGYTKKYPPATKTIILFSHQPVFDTLKGAGLVYLPKEAYLMTQLENYYNIYLFAGHAHANIGTGRQVLTEDISSIDLELTKLKGRQGTPIRIIKVRSNGIVDYSTLLPIDNFIVSTPVLTTASFIPSKIPAPTYSKLPMSTIPQLAQSPTVKPESILTPTISVISGRQHIKKSLERWQEKNKYTLSSFASLGVPLMFYYVGEEDYVVLGSEAWAISTTLSGDGFVLYNSQISIDNWVIKWRCGYAEGITLKGLAVKDKKTIYVQINRFNMIYTIDGGETWKSDLELDPELFNK